MSIESERTAFPAALEQGKGGGIDVAPALVLVALEDLPGPFLRRSIEVNEVDRAAIPKAPPPLDRLAAAHPHHQGGIRLGEDVVGGEQRDSFGDQLGQRQSGSLVL